MRSRFNNRVRIFLKIIETNDFNRHIGLLMKVWIVKRRAALLRIFVEFQFGRTNINLAACPVILSNLNNTFAHTNEPAIVNTIDGFDFCEIKI